MPHTPEKEQPPPVVEDIIDDDDDDVDQNGNGNNGSDDDDDAPDEYTVETIRNKRRNPETGGIEYYIKWENYPENENTWEPEAHLSCPEKIAEYEEKEKAKRKRRGIQENLTNSKRPKRDSSIAETTTTTTSTNTRSRLLVEDDSDTESISSHGSAKKPQEKYEEPQLKGFKRNLALEKIVGSCTDDKEKLWFFIKWKGLHELDMVDVDDIEDKAPKQLCRWYRERLYQTIKTHEQNDGETTCTN